MAKRKKSTADAPVMAPMKPSMSVEGPMAKKLHGLKPGATVTLTVRGTVTETGINTYNDRTPTARVEISRISTPSKRRK